MIAAMTMFVACFGGLILGAFLGARIDRRGRPAAGSDRRLDLDHDPGPLDDTTLREYLRFGAYVRPSRAHDRVQYAFERLIRERDTARNVLTDKVQKAQGWPAGQPDNAKDLP